MEGTGAITVTVQVVGAPAPTPYTAAPVPPVEGPTLARTGGSFEMVVVVALALVVLGAVIVKATRIRMEQFRA